MLLPGAICRTKQLPTSFCSIFDVCDTIAKIGILDHNIANH